MGLRVVPGQVMRGCVSQGTAPRPHHPIPGCQAVGVPSSMATPSSLQVTAAASDISARETPEVKHLARCPQSLPPGIRSRTRWLVLAT